LLNFLGFFSCGVTIKKNARSLKSFTKVTSSSQIVGNWFSYVKKTPECSELKQNLLNSQQKQYCHLLFESFEQNIFEYQQHNFVNDQKTIFTPSQKQTILPFFSSQTICNYVAQQLAASIKFKDKSFKNSLQKGTAKVAAQLSKKFGFSAISGIKIVCCGR
jgi:hypothetical protein